MFYRPETGHNLPHNPFNAIVSPRPIGWISTRCGTGDNLAPYSFFNAVAYVPPQVMFASTGLKDSAHAIRESGVFCVNIVSTDLAAAMNATSASFPRGTDEFAAAGIAKAECETIDCPRVAEAPASLECRVTEIVALRGTGNLLILGEVTGVHMRDDCVVAGRFDVTRFHPLSRLGYRDYASVTEVFEMVRPDDRTA
ncbi:flavin reductase family protein [Falsirhodobacter sp. 20TX0035]|uniref:flavin reductase family protein n=1 Tax=Falsirhodobacter sp. 20TX0035 TaxID=3022019 RepID=UPI00232F09F2|nr:flavin reductase family protein [Falsirhodobacter sp. 20TX0035]MDB6455079.1 flavin reductase family protein [Falsirhodobacter sp. 20TX0035]